MSQKCYIRFLADGDMLGHFSTVAVRVIQKIYILNVIRDCILKVSTNNFNWEQLPKIEDHTPKWVQKQQLPQISHIPLVIKINVFKSLYIIYHLIQNLMLMKLYKRNNDYKRTLFFKKYQKRTKEAKCQVCDAHLTLLYCKPLFDLNKYHFAVPTNDNFVICCSNS